MPDDTPQTASPSYRLAALDQDFLMSDAMRGVRFLLEYAKVDESYWRSVINFEKFAAQGMVDAEDLALFRYAEDAEGIWQQLLAMGLRVPAGR